jgi:hypothetical protein
MMVLSKDGGVPAGSTLFIGPGTYKVTEPLAITNPVNVSAYGATFDFGTTTFEEEEAAVSWGPEREDANVSGFEGLSFRGLQVTRSAGGVRSLSLYPGVGFEWFRLKWCNISDVDARYFSIGHFLRGDPEGRTTGSGCVHNALTNLTTWNCKYGIVLRNEFKVLDDKSWVNDNNFFGGKLQLESDRTDPLTAEAVAIQLESGATIPNNNRFYGMSLEGPWGRKVFNQGRDNYFLFCRYEGEPATDGVQTMVASGGTGYPDTGTISASSGGFEGEFTASGGAIASVTITNQGSGYSTPPTPIFSGSGSGAQSTLTLGDGYTIEFDGTDADANALLWGNKLKDNKVLNSSGALGNQKIDSSVADLTNQTKVASLSLLRSVVDASAETADEVIVGVDSDTNAVTVTLRGTDVVPGRVVTVKDETGNAGTNNITIATSGTGVKIDGQDDLTIEVDYGYVQLYSSGGGGTGNWHVISAKLT